MGTDHLHEAKLLAENCDGDPMLRAIAHAVVSIAESLRELNARDDEATNGPRS